MTAYHGGALVIDDGDDLISGGHKIPGGATVDAGGHGDDSMVVAIKYTSSQVNILNRLSANVELKY